VDAESRSYLLINVCETLLSQKKRRLSVSLLLICERFSFWEKMMRKSMITAGIAAAAFGLAGLVSVPSFGKTVTLK